MIGYLVNGKYVKKPPVSTDDNVLTEVARKANIEEQRRDGAVDFIKPYNEDGSVNQDFIAFYPEQAKRLNLIGENIDGKFNRNQVDRERS
jgi:hypothetical protein